MEDYPIRIAHISDLHFSHFSLNPIQIFSKRWIGNFNLFLSRQKDYETKQLHSLIPLFQSLKIKHLIVSGDLSTTSLNREFEQAALFLKSFQDAGINVYSIPGNHDHYTKKAYATKAFYQFFPSIYEQKGNTSLDAFNLKDHGVCARQLFKEWWLVGLDTARATSLLSSRGCFSEEIEAHLEKTLSLIPSQHKVILANHFPFFEQESARKILVRGPELQKLLRRFPKVKLYLHGHTHRHCIADLQSNNLPIVLDSGSTSNREAGTWNLIEISPKGCEIQAFRKQTLSETQNSIWQPSSPCFFTWS